MIVEHEAYCANMKKSHKSLLDQKTKSYESNLLGLESEKIK